MDNLNSEIQQILTELFKLLEIEAEVSVDETDDGTMANITSEQANILIGYHGDTINSLEHLLNLIVLKKAGEWKNVRIDVDGYKEMRKSKIAEIAKRAVDKARFLQKPISLLPMNSFERKIVHEYVSETEDLTSLSEGDGRNRKVVIMPKNSESLSKDLHAE